MANHPADVPEDDPVPAELRTVVELFRGELAKVAFPDVDAAVLAREVEAVRARAAEVARARAALATAETALEQRTAALGQLASRGLAYARIYADAHPELSGLAARLTAATTRTPEIVEAPPPRRRGRPPKLPRAELPFTDAAGDSAPA